MRKHLLKVAGPLSVALAVALFAPQRASADDDDPPSRVARLSYAHGNVSFNPAGTDEWVSAVVNRPITTGDKLWTDNGARAELHIGSAAIRLSSNTGFSFLNLDDRTAQIRVTEGTLNVRVRSLGDDETFEIDTPNLAFTVLRTGSYKINVNEAGDTTFIEVRDGQGEVTGGGSAYTIHPREAGTFAGIDQLDADIQRFGDDDDDFDRWCNDRDRHADHSNSARYVSTDVIGYDDLDDYGGWRPVPEYGTVWFPHTTVVGWAPYRYGHWVWISPWGWTWIDDEPWGFAPFHYGRWVAVGGVWGWVPCPPRPVAVVGVAYVRPVYAPALVAWVGGPHFSVGIAVGSGGGVGVAWFPLGPRDVYCPSYHVSERYVQNVNVSNTTVINQTHITNVYNNVYVNKTVSVTNVTYQNQTAPNAVTATSHQAFTSAQPVARNMVKVDARELASAPVAPLTPAVAPQQRSVLGAGAEARVRPPAAALARPVVAKVAPPPPPAPFVKQQQVIQANGGRPPAVSQIRQVQAENVQQAHANVKIAPPAQPATPRNVQANRPADNGNRQTGNVQNNQANVPNNSRSDRNDNNRPPSVNNSSPANSVNRPVNSPANAGNAPTNASNSSKVYNDRPSSSRPNNQNNSNAVNPQLDQKHQQQLDQLRQRQDQERQKVEQQQQQERQKVAQQQADQQRQQQHQQQLDEKHQQQLQQLEQKHDQQQQKLQQQQQQERQKQQQQQKPPKEDKKPPKDEKKPPQRG
jgi:hypothetical protein